MEITTFLKAMADKEASDLFFSVGAPVNVKVKVKGHTLPISRDPLKPGDAKKTGLQLYLRPAAGRIRKGNGTELCPEPERYWPFPR